MADHHLNNDAVSSPSYILHHTTAAWYTSVMFRTPEGPYINPLQSAMATYVREDARAPCFLRPQPPTETALVCAHVSTMCAEPLITSMSPAVNPQSFIARHGACTAPNHLFPTTTRLLVSTSFLQIQDRRENNMRVVL